MLRYKTFVVQKINYLFIINGFNFFRTQLANPAETVGTIFTAIIITMELKLTTDRKVLPKYRSELKRNLGTVYFTLPISQGLRILKSYLRMFRTMNV